MAKLIKQTIILNFLLTCFFYSISLAQQTGSVSGYVIIKNTGENAGGFLVEAVNGSGIVLASEYTDDFGEYTISGINTTQAYVKVAEQYGYKEVYFDSKTGLASANAISITAGNTVAGINFQIEETSSPTDSDNDGIRDSEEVIYGYDGYITNPHSTDTDGDGISDFQETTQGIDGFFTNPNLTDTDNDTIADNADPIPSPCYILTTLSGSAVQGGVIKVTCKLMDFYNNLIVKDDVQFTIKCDKNAVFASSVLTGNLVSGAGTQSVVVQTYHGIVEINLTSPAAETVNVYPFDSSNLKILCFSNTSLYKVVSIPTDNLESRWLDTQMYGEIDMFLNDIPIGFNFDFYGKTTDKINIHSNGFLTFDYNIPYQNMYTNAAIPTQSSPNNFMAALWDDLDVTNGTVLYLSTNNNFGKRFQVEWQNIMFYDDAVVPVSSLTFDATLYSGSNLIQFTYKKLKNGKKTFAKGSSATVGIENANGSLGIQYSYNTSSLNENTSIIFSNSPSPLAYFLNPVLDLDNDGLSNAIEINTIHSDPLKSDTDGDGLPDKWEYDYGLSPVSSDGSNGKQGDFDNDGLTNYQELASLTSPNNADTDDDSVSDGLEVNIYNSDPRSPDTDVDGLADGEEITEGSDGFKTNPILQDTDNDGKIDSVDPIPVYSKLIIIKPSDAFLGHQSEVAFQIWSIDGELLTVVNNFHFNAIVTGNAYFINHQQITSGAGTNSVTVKLQGGEARLKVIDYTEERIYFSAHDISSSGVRFPKQQSGYWSIPYYPYNISNSSNLIPQLTGDDQSIYAPIGFNFSFYGNVYQNVTISTNGYLTFGSQGTDATNDNIPNINQPNNIIAPFWDDLIIDSGAVYKAVIGQAPARKLIIEWSGVSFKVNQFSNASFYVVLHEIDSSIEFYYANLTNTGSPIRCYGNDATIGIENDNGLSGTLLSYNQPSLTPYKAYLLFDGITPYMDYKKNPTGDDDLDGIINSIEWQYGTDPFNSDTDSDGLSDSEEIYTYGTSPLNQNSDGDKFTDYQEVLAGTSPVSELSYLHITSFYKDSLYGDMIITWSSVQGKRYTIFVKSNATGNNFVLLNDNILSQGDTTTYIDSGGGPNQLPHPSIDQKRFYKITLNH